MPLADKRSRDRIYPFHLQQVSKYQKQQELTSVKAATTTRRMRALRLRYAIQQAHVTEPKNTPTVAAMIKNLTASGGINGRPNGSAVVVAGVLEVKVPVTT